jgi:PST family polysaccharide transporter
MTRYEQIQAELRQLKNLTSLACIQGGNAIVPLLMFPYLLSKIGVDKFSKLATLEAASFIVLTISLYSFDVVGLKHISRARITGAQALARVYYSILYARVILLALCSAIFVIFVYFLAINYVAASLVWLLFPLGIVLQSSYYYQATSKNFPLAIFVLVSRLTACVAMVIFANEHTTLIYASAFITFSYLASGIISVLYLHSHLSYVSPMKVKRHMIAMLSQGKNIFAGGVFVLLYRGGNILLLSAFNTSPIAISIYAIAEKYIKMIQALTLPITQILSVRLVRAMVKQGGPSKAIKEILWINTRPQILISLLMAIAFLMVGFTLSERIERLIPEQALFLMAIMLPATVFGVANHMYGTIAYSSLGLDRLYARIMFYCGIAFIVISALSIILLEDVGAAFAFLFSEVALAGVFLYFLNSKVPK